MVSGRSQIRDQNCYRLISKTRPPINPFILFPKASAELKPNFDVRGVRYSANSGGCLGLKAEFRSDLLPGEATLHDAPMRPGPSAPPPRLTSSAVVCRDALSVLFHFHHASVQDDAILKLPRQSTTDHVHAAFTGWRHCRLHFGIPGKVQSPPNERVQNIAKGAARVGEGLPSGPAHWPARGEPCYEPLYAYIWNCKRAYCPRRSPTAQRLPSAVLQVVFKITVDPVCGLVNGL